MPPSSQQSALREPPESAGLPAIVLRLLDGLGRARPLDELCAELAIPAATAARVVAKLARLGLLPVAPAGRFSAAEEAFFASEVRDDPLEEEPRPGFWARARSLWV
jgi:hypothetical protein